MIRGGDLDASQVSRPGRTPPGPRPGLARFVRSSHPPPQRARVPRDAGAQRHARPRLLPRGPPGRRRDHPERPARGDERRPPPRPDARAVAAGAEGRQAGGGPGDRRDQPARGVPRRVEEPQGLQPGRLPGPPLRLHGARAAGGPGLPHPRGPRAAAAGRVDRPGRLQHGALPGDPLREDLRDGDADRHLPAAGRTARARSTRRGSTRSRRSPPASGSSSPPSPTGRG